MWGTAVLWGVALCVWGAEVNAGGTVELHFLAYEDDCWDNIFQACDPMFKFCLTKPHVFYDGPQKCFYGEQGRSRHFDNTDYINLSRYSDIKGIPNPWIIQVASLEGQFILEAKVWDKESWPWRDEHLRTWGRGFVLPTYESRDHAVWRTFSMQSGHYKLTFRARQYCNEGWTGGSCTQRIQTVVPEEVSTQPTIGPKVTTQPTIGLKVTTQPTIGPKVTTQPTIGPKVTTQPTIGPKVTTQPTIGPKVTTQPTIEPDDPDEAESEKDAEDNKEETCEDKNWPLQKGNLCYQILKSDNGKPKGLQRHVAQAECVKLGGHLPELKTYNQYRDFQTLIGQNGLRRVWLGAKDNGKKNKKDGRKFIWTHSNTTVNFEEVNPQKVTTNNSHNKEHCMEQWNEAWNDIYCTYWWHTVCQMELNSH